jgi:peptidyl-prolyl cis-trans isomerase A (cyclophilin A)
MRALILQSLFLLCALFSYASAQAPTTVTPSDANKDNGAITLEKKDSATQMQANTNVNPKIKFKTTLGDFTVELYADKAPITVANFLKYVESGFYSGTIFHRVIGNFMVQGGGFDKDFNKKANFPPIVLEAQKGLSNLRGTIAMARTGDPNSATSQFFVNVVDNKNLDNYGGGYAVFGKVIEGMDNIDAIRFVDTTSKGPHANVPVNTVEIISATKL